MLEIGRLLYPEAATLKRPCRRWQCVDEPRPCPWVGCEYHLYLDVNPEIGSIKYNFPYVESWEIIDSCALDVAEEEGCTLDEVAVAMNLTRERVRQIEESVLDILKENRVLLRIRAG